MRSEHNGIVPPPEMADAARKGLALAARFHRGAKSVALRRARQLAERHPLSWRDLEAVGDFFARHPADGPGQTEGWGEDDDPSPAYVSWLLWGGDAGKSWIGAIMARCSKAGLPLPQSGTPAVHAR